jgi:hypothetical protein
MTPERQFLPRFLLYSSTIVASATTDAPTTRLRRFSDALPFIVTIATGSSLLLSATITHHREQHRNLAAYYLQRAAESQRASRVEAYVADLAEGKVTSPILPFVNPIGDPGPHRVAAAAHEERATRYSRMSSEYDAAADRPWGSVNLPARIP